MEGVLVVAAKFTRDLLDPMLLVIRDDGSSGLLPVTSEVAGSSPVVPATFFNRYNGFPGLAEARPTKAMLQSLRVCLRWWKNFSCRSGQNSGRLLHARKIR